MSTDFSYLNIPEEHAKAYLVLETEFRHVHTALEEVLRYFGYCQSLLQAVKESHLFGEGADVSPHEMSFHDIHAALGDRLVRRIVCLWNSAKFVRGSEEDFMKHLDSDKPRYKDSVGSWSLEYLVWSVYRKHPALTETQKDQLRNIYKNIWDVVSSPEYEKYVLLRHKMLAHLARDVKMDSEEESDILSETENSHLALWTERAVKVFEELAETAMLEIKDGPAHRRYDLLMKQIVLGATPFVDIYRKIIRDKQNQSLLMRASPLPSHTDAMLTEEIIWRSPDGSFYYAEKILPGRWRLYKKVSQGGVAAKQVICEGNTPAEIKITAELHASGQADENRQSFPLMLEAINLAEYLRSEMGKIPESANCVWAAIQVAESKNWDRYMGMESPAQILMISKDGASQEPLKDISENIATLLRSNGVPVAVRILTESEFSEIMPVPPIMSSEADKRILHQFPFIGDLPSGTPSKIGIVNDSNKKEVIYEIIPQS